MNHLGRIKLLPAREQVASVLRKAIISRELTEGQELTLEDVARQVGVSSMPVREAFQILDSEGLIKLRPNKGAVVLGINEKTIIDHFETRALLEGEMAARASRPEVDISAIEAVNEEAEQALARQVFTHYGDQNQAFHYAIWEAGNNEKMRNILSQLWNGLAIGRDVTKADYARKSHQEHQEILAAIRTRSAGKAKELMEQHIIRSMNDILTRFTKA